ATLVAAATPVSPRGDPSREAGVGGPAQRGDPRCWAMAAEGLDTDEGRRDGLGRECALRERVLDAAHRGARGAERLTDEQHVAAGLQRGDGGAAGGGAAGHGVHLEIVAEEDAAKTEAVAEEVGADGARERGRSSARSEEHTSELQSRVDLVCRLLL